MFKLPGLTDEPVYESVEEIIESDEKETTPRQERFAEEYVKDFNGSRAARDAGYAPDYAGQIAYILLQKKHVRRAVRLAKQRRAEQQAGETVDKQWIINRLIRIAEADVADFADWGPEHMEKRAKDGALIVSNGVELVPSAELSRSMTYALTEIGNTKDGVKFKLADKRAALADLAKILGLVTEKTEVTGKVETSGPDIGKMTPEQLSAYEAFLIAMAASGTATA